MWKLPMICDVHAHCTPKNFSELLLHRAANEIRFELSLPSQMSPDGRTRR
jgi:hypothetical protein